jgi:hypothetical protein
MLITSPVTIQQQQQQQQQQRQLQRNTVPKASRASGTFCFASRSTPISSHVTVKQQQQNKPSRLSWHRGATIAATAAAEQRAMQSQKPAGPSGTFCFALRL